MRKKLKIEKKKNKAIKKERKEKVVVHHLPQVKWACSICGKTRIIYINERNRSLYTPEREKTNKCINCKGR